MFYICSYMNDIKKHTANDGLAISDKLNHTLSELREAAESLMLAGTYNKQLEKVEDVMFAMAVGLEIGLPPVTSIMLGKKLNQSTIFSVLKGKSMGIDPITAIENIHIIPTKNGDISVTGVHIITAQLAKAGVTFDILEDATPLYKYMDANRNVYDVDIVKSNPELFYIAKTDADEKGKIKVALSGVPATKRTSIKFRRKLFTGEFNEIIIRYTLQEATDAGLYNGVHSIKGIDVKGKDNWNENPATMLRNRVLSIGGRIIASDYLKGTYEFSEISYNVNNEVVIPEGTTTILGNNGNPI